MQQYDPHGVPVPRQPQPEEALTEQLLELKRLEWLREAWRELEPEQRRELAFAFVNRTLQRFAQQMDAKQAEKLALEAMPPADELRKHVDSYVMKGLMAAALGAVSEMAKRGQGAHPALKQAIEAVIAGHASELLTAAVRASADTALESMKG